ncbi:hypothetical protein QFC19_007418 [Naganishia cerealis]|uniref:Uncharacterized protein n=1 Tax=Naganishia cerealis TaxID=610337 RepID=A0ACC2VA10_9TREE|nr:hypothetical protein QFC19_007418 [Naganishia cerealis]
MSSEEDSDLGTTHSPIGLLSKNGRLQLEYEQKSGRGRQPTIYPHTLASRASSKTDTDTEDSRLELGLLEGRLHISQGDSSERLPFDLMSMQRRQASSAGCSKLVDADGLDGSNCASPSNVEGSKEVIWAGNNVDELSENWETPHKEGSCSAPRRRQNSQKDKQSVFSRSRVRSHSRHQSPRVRTYNQRQLQQHRTILWREPLPDFDIYKDGIKQLSELLGRGTITSTGILDVYLRQIDKHNDTLRALSALYGLKPTVGMLSRSGIVPFAPHFDTPGPMTKNVWDLALLMDVMQGDDSEDPITLSIERPPRTAQNWHNIDPWKRPGRDLLSKEISEAFESAVSTMGQLGATITDPADIPSVVDGSLWRCADTSRSLVVAADCKEYLGKYLQNLGGEGGCRSVEDIIVFNTMHSDIEMPPGHYGQEVLERTLLAVNVDSPEYAEAKRDMAMTAGIKGLDAVFEKYDLDVIFMIREGHHSLANMVGYPIG